MEAPALSSGRKWLYRLAASVLLPLILLGLVEAGLRLGGYGYATGFLLERTENDRRVLIENPKFGWRFFPSTVARSPLPLSILRMERQCR